MQNPTRKLAFIKVKFDNGGKYRDCSPITILAFSPLSVLHKLEIDELESSKHIIFLVQQPFLKFQVI